MSEAGGKKETAGLPPEVESLISFVGRVDQENAGSPEFAKRRNFWRGILKKIQEAVSCGELTPDQANSLVATTLAEKEMLSDHDTLTDLYNRQGVARRFSEESSRVRREGKPLSLCFLDLDSLRTINNTGGHKAGDKALISFAKILQERLGDEDIVGRIGGDEFIVVIAGAEGKKALEAIERISLEITERKLLNLTFSAGVVQIEGEYDFKRLSGLADVALYVAKRAGKDQVVLWEEGMPRNVEK